MPNLAAAALLPAGLMDVLPPFAAFEAQTVERLMAHFAGFGYERVKPPLIEFEETMLAGSGAALATDTFRLMDPVSQRMLALRPDMTMQVARIAASRLGHRPRPLRLGYAGQVLRVRGSQLRPERQFGQVGAEIIGCAAAAADVEVIVMATSALAALGIDGLIGRSRPADPGAGDPRRPRRSGAATDRRLRLALDRKDIAAIAGAGARASAPASPTCCRGLVADQRPGRPGAGRRSPRSTLPPAAAAERALPGRRARRPAPAAPALTLTIDPVENRGFEYHTGVTFALFAAAAPDELGRGGRYLTEAGEAATGITLFIDAVLRALPRAAAASRACCCRPTRRRRVARDLRAATAGSPSAALDGGADPLAEAQRLGCTHVFIDGRSERRPPPAMPRRRAEAWPTSSSSAPSGATRARARSSTGCPSAPTSSCASRAATTPATRWSSTA